MTAKSIEPVKHLQPARTRKRRADPLPSPSGLAGLCSTCAAKSGTSVTTKTGNGFSSESAQTKTKRNNWLPKSTHRSSAGSRRYSGLNNDERTSFSGMCATGPSDFRGRDQSIDFQDLFIWHAIALILLPKNFSQGFEIVERNDRKLGPFRVRLQSGLKLPFAGVLRDPDQTDHAFVGVFTPFVFLHDW